MLTYKHTENWAHYTGKFNTSSVDSEAIRVATLAPTAYWPGVSGARPARMGTENTREVGPALCLRDAQEAVGRLRKRKSLDACGHWEAHVDYAARHGLNCRVPGGDCTAPLSGSSPSWDGPSQPWWSTGTALRSGGGVLVMNQQANNQH